MVEKSREEKHMVIYSVVDTMVGGYRVLLYAMKANEEQHVEVCTSVLYRDSIMAVHMALNHVSGGSNPSPDAKKIQN